MTEDQLIFEYGGKMVVLEAQPFSEDMLMDLDTLLAIDYNNILGEILTFPVIFNRIALIKAAINKLYENKVDRVKAVKADLFLSFKKKYEKGQLKATDSLLNAEVNASSELAEARAERREAKYSLDYIDSVYWSAKVKSDLLSKISDKVRPDEFEKELIEDTLNGVMIKIREKVIR